MCRSLLSTRLYTAPSRRLLRDKNGKMDVVRAKIVKYGPGLFCVYGCIDGTVFITATIGMSLIQENIMTLLEQTEWIRKQCTGTVHDTLIKLSESISKWNCVKPFGLEGRDVLAFACTLLILRSPFVSMPYRAVMLSTSGLITTSKYFQNTFTGSIKILKWNISRAIFQPVLLLIPLVYLLLVLKYKSNNKHK